jgi:hypothetical protein
MKSSQPPNKAPAMVPAARAPSCLPIIFSAAALKVSAPIVPPTMAPKGSGGGFLASLKRTLFSLAIASLSFPDAT